MHPPEERTDCRLAILGSSTSESISKEESYSVDWVTNSEHQGEIGVQLHNRGKEEYVQKTGDPLKYLLLLPGPVIKVNGKLQQPNQGQTTNGPEPSRMNQPTR